MKEKDTVICIFIMLNIEIEMTIIYKKEMNYKIIYSNYTWIQYVVKFIRFLEKIYL